jgi:hypothetical protein
MGKMKDAPSLVRWINTGLFAFLVPYPFVFFGTLFASGDPSRGALYSFTLQLLIWATWMYPILFFWGQKYVLRALEMKRSTFRLLIPFSPAGFIAIYWTSAFTISVISQ